MSRNRHSHHSANIRKVLSEILLKEAKDPRFQKITITHVEAAPDLSFAKVFFSIYPTQDIEALTESLNHASGFFSSKLGKALKSRNTPRLMFQHDAGFDHSEQIEDLLKKVL